MPEPVLKTEMMFYARKRAELLPHHAGQFALIRGEELLGTFTTEVEAYEAGLRIIGNKPFLIQEITAEDRSLRVPALFLGMVP